MNLCYIGAAYINQLSSATVSNAYGAGIMKNNHVLQLPLSDFGSLKSVSWYFCILSVNMYTMFVQIVISCLLTHVILFSTAKSCQDITHILMGC